MITLQTPSNEGTGGRRLGKMVPENAWLHGGPHQNYHNFWRPMKYLMSSATAAEFVDMDPETFRRTVGSIADSIDIEGDTYYRPEDLELVIYLLFRTPDRNFDNVVPFPA